MPSAHFTEHLPHAADDMLELVMDVENYPKFLNFVSGLRIIGGRKKKQNGERFEAEMAIRYKMISERVRCHVEVDRKARTVSVTKSDKSGALKELSNNWVFYELPDGSALVDLVVHVKLKAAPLNFLVSSKFDYAGAKILDAFMRRASQLYAKKGEGSVDVAALKAELGIS